MMPDLAPPQPRRDIYAEVTDRIMAALDAGTVPWQKPWTGTIGPTNLTTQRPYRGVNTLLLGLSGFASPHWLTFRQADTMGGYVRAGQRGTRIFFWKALEDKTDHEEENAEQTLTPRPRLVSRAYTVFNVEQCEDIPAPTPPPATVFAPVHAADQLLKAIRPTPRLTEGGAQAFFSPSIDAINVPPKDSFTAPGAYYSTLFHELTHWTGHKSRLGRDTLAQMTAFGDSNYSKEELVAEMGAGFLCAMTGIENAALHRNSAAYIANWLERLRDDRRLVVSAAGHAQRAVDFLCGTASDIDSNIRETTR